MTERLSRIGRWQVRSIRAISCLGTIGFFLVARDAHGEPGAAEKATAEALFQQGTELMNEKQYAAACEKFAGSQQIDPALGTALRLADCNDRIGKTASALGDRRSPPSRRFRVRSRWKAASLRSASASTSSPLRARMIW